MIVFLLSIGVIMFLAGFVLASPSTLLNANSGGHQDQLWKSFSHLLSLTSNVFSAFADITIKLLDQLWLVTPDNLKFFLGLFFSFIIILASIGVLTVWSGAQFWRRHFG